jgi:hypothetical protein
VEGWCWSTGKSYRVGGYMKRIEEFWASRFDRELRPDEEEILTTIHEWIPEIVKEVREKTIKTKSESEPAELDFFIGKPTYYHARMILRTVLESGFIRCARQTGKVYEFTNMMPDKAAIRNFLDRNLLESEEEANLRYGTLQYFCAITTSFTERNLSWVLLGRPALNLLGETAKHSFYKNWKGKIIREMTVDRSAEFWGLFLVFYIMYANNPKIRNNPWVSKRIVVTFMNIGKLRIHKLRIHNMKNLSKVQLRDTLYSKISKKYKVSKDTFDEAWKELDKTGFIDKILKKKADLIN